MKMLIDNGNPHYENGIPEEVTECDNCHVELDLKNKSSLFIPWCTKCRTENIRQQEIEYANKVIT